MMNSCENLECARTPMAITGTFLERWLSLVLIAVGLAVLPAVACTSLLVSRGASADGSVIITYHCDAGGAYATLGIVPAMDHPPGEMIDAGPRDPVTKAPRGRIPQVPHTYKVVGLMNEHQLSVSETTFGGREELINTNALMEYPHLMQLALQRARTAREAIQVMTQLVADYGYASEGESISIADTAGGVDSGDRGDGPRRERRRLGGGAGARRPDLLSRQPCPAGGDSSQRPGQLPLFGKRREPRGEQGLVRSEIRAAVSFLRRLLPGDAVYAAGFGHAGMEHLAARGALPGTSRPTTTAPNPAPNLIPSSSSRTTSSRWPTSSPCSATTTKEPSST